MKADLGPAPPKFSSYDNIKKKNRVSLPSISRSSFTVHDNGNNYGLKDRVSSVKNTDLNTPLTPARKLSSGKSANDDDGFPSIFEWVL